MKLFKRINPHAFSLSSINITAIRKPWEKVLGKIAESWRCHNPCRNPWGRQNSFDPDNWQGSWG